MSAPSGFELGVLVTAAGLGFRHGFDLDHLAAIADLTGSSRTRRDGLRLSTLYAAGHGLVVLVLGVVAVTFGAHLPDGIDAVMGPLVGVSLLVLGGVVVYSLVRHGREARLRSRWTLLFGAGRHRHVGTVPVDPFTSVGSRGAFSVGLLHGVGVETPTQILVLGAAAGAGAGLPAVGYLTAFLGGLFSANLAVAVAASTGVLSAERSYPAFVVLSVLFAAASAAVGTMLLVGAA